MGGHGSGDLQNQSSLIPARIRPGQAGHNPSQVKSCEVSCCRILVKQCHQPPFFGLMVSIPPIEMVKFGAIEYCFTNIGNVATF